MSAFRPVSIRKDAHGALSTKRINQNNGYRKDEFWVTVWKFTGIQVEESVEEDCWRVHVLQHGEKSGLLKDDENLSRTTGEML